MSVIMHDALASLGPEAAEAYKKNRLFDILYADDTLLIGTRAEEVGQFAAAVERIGATYGMSLHWGKTQALSVCTDTRLHGTQGDLVEDSGSMVYLGGLLTADGRPDFEISRKIGAAAGDFKNLCVFWGHASIGKRRKL